MRRLRTPIMLSLVVATGLTLSGCQRQRAEITLDKVAESMSVLLENYNANEHFPSEIQNIQSRIDSATNQLEADAAQSLELAKQASTEASQLIERIKPVEGNSIFNEAREEIKIADVNDLRREDQDRYQRIRDLMTQAEAARAENNWDDVINRSREVINEVDSGLATLKNDAERRRIDATESLTELQQIGGNIFTPEIVIAVQDTINTATKISNEERDYRLAINKFSEGVTRAQEGIDQVMREKSRQSLEEVEGFLTTALIEGALDFKKEDYESTFSLYDNLLQEYNAGRYTLVLEGADSLRPRAERLVVQTKRAASADRIQTMGNDIKALENDGILEYIPGSLDQLNTFLANATTTNERDTEEAFDEVKQISIEAREELGRVKERYNTLTSDEIRTAKNRLEESRAVYGEMTGFFQAAPTGSTEIEMAFNAQKNSRQAELGRILDEAAVNLNVADLRRQQEQNRGAIVLAQEVAATAERSLGEVYNLVGQNAAIELSKLITFYEQNGARIYAQQELVRSREMLEEMKTALRGKQYRESVSLAADARAEVELLAQRIAGRATEDIREARETLTAATSEKTRQYRAEMLGQVSVLIETAEIDLQQGKLKLALEKAQQATELAQQAETESNLLASKEAIDLAQTSLEKAQTAGAELYAGREVEDARRLLSSSRALFTAEDYVKAEDLAMSSAQRSRNGLYKKIDEADAAIATAKSVGGWDFDSSTLARANTKVREANQLIEAGNYAESGDRAEDARIIAEALTGRAKDHSFKTRTSKISDNLQDGTKQGINFFQPEDSIEIRRQLSQLRNEYTRDDYERIMTEVEKLEARLRGVLGETDVLVTTVAAQQGRRLDSLMDDGALLFAAVEASEARNNLRYAELDYQRGLYKAAHSYLDRAIKQINTIEQRLYVVEYKDEIEKLFAEYRLIQDDFSNVLALDPNELKELAVGPNGAAQSVAISAQVTPMQFRSKVDELYTRATLLKTPRELSKVHENIILAFSEGRIAALNFEKLAILNRVATPVAEELIDTAFMRMNRSNEIVTNVQRQIISEENRFRIVDSSTSSLVNLR